MSGGTRYVVFNADWQDPPGTVVKVFGTREAAEAFRDGPGDGCGYSIVEIPEPEADVPADPARVEITDEAVAKARDAYQRAYPGGIVGARLIQMRAALEAVRPYLSGEK